MFAPIATRFQTYSVALPQSARTHQQRLLAHPLVAEWLELGGGGARQRRSVPCG
jgi:hypothetical protein